MGLNKAGPRRRLHLQGDQTTKRAHGNKCNKHCVDSFQLASLVVTVVLAGALHLKMYYMGQGPGPCSELEKQPHGIALQQVKLAQSHATLHGSIPQHGRPPPVKDVLLDNLPPGLFNPSIAIHEGQAWAVVRSQYILPGNRWALGRNHLVHLNLTRWSVTSINQFDPWQNVAELGVPCKRNLPHTAIDTWGPDDTKLFSWPGNGLWALTAGRPRIERCISVCCNCTQLAFQQWLIQVAPEGVPVDPQPFSMSLQQEPPSGYPGWKPSTVQQRTPRGRRHLNVCGRSSANHDKGRNTNLWPALWLAPPLPITLEDAHAVYGNQAEVEEKNWMLFNMGMNLYFSYSVAPVHRVYIIQPNGRAKPAYESDSRAVLAPLGVPFQDIHGGPNIIHITSTHLQAAGLHTEDYLLGVVHFHERVYYAPDPLYQHFVVKIEPRPPFKVLQVSRELILQFHDKKWWKQQVAFVSGVQVAMLQPHGKNASEQATSSSKADLKSSEGSPNLVGSDGLVPHVLFSYGSADSFSRVLVLPLAEVEQLFVSAAWNNSRAQHADSTTNTHAGLNNWDHSVASALAAHEHGAAPVLKTVLKNRKLGAGLLYWDMQQCGGANMCSELQKANKNLFSCWALMPAAGALKSASQECHCSGPEQASLAHLDSEQLQSFIKEHSWVDAFFANAGMPRQPYFGAKAVQVAVLRNPVTRYLAHLAQEQMKYDAPHIKPKFGLNQVIQAHAHDWHWLVPDNYMTRFLYGHWSLLDYGYTSRPVTPGMFQHALGHLQRMDIVLVLEEAQTPEVGELLTAVGLRPYSMDAGARAELHNLHNVSGDVMKQVESWHSYDMQLYSYARQRHAEALRAWANHRKDT